MENKYFIRLFYVLFRGLSTSNSYFLLLKQKKVGEKAAEKIALHLCKGMLIYYMFFNEHGEVSEWSKVLDSKSSVVNSHRGFESHPLCHLQISPCSVQGLF